MNETRRHLLIAIDGGSDIREIDLGAFRSNRVTFGRTDGNDIVFHSQIVSRSHGAFEFINGGLYVCDIGSTNGIIVNKRLYKHNTAQTADRCLLSDGDIIKIDSENPMGRHPNGVLMIYRTHSTPGVWKKQSVPVGGTILIGRDKRSDIYLRNMSVSRRHASVSYDGIKWRITDLNSSNGLFVNGARVHDSCELNDKDVICAAVTRIFFTNGFFIYKSDTDGTRVDMRGISRVVTVKRQRKMILRDVNLTVEPNEFVAIIGGSGAGKSTVMNAMSGFEQATAGTVSVNGTELYGNYQILKNMIGYVPQQDIIYENITLQKMLEFSAKMRMPEDVGRAEREHRIDEVLKMVELEEHKDKFIRSLSGGQKKRASIAVELLADPGLFFLDEPTSGLDPGTEESLMKTLSRLSKQKGKTIVMVTHTTQNLHLCDKILFMGKGGVVCYYGAPDECKRFFGAKSLTEIYNMLLTDEAVEKWAAKYRQQYGAAQQDTPIGGTVKKVRRASFFRQLAILAARYMTLIKNDTQRLLMVFLQPILIAILLALVASDDVYDVYNSTQSIMFAMSCAGIWVGLFSSIQEICKERNILKREYMANLRLGAYVLSKFGVQLLISAIEAAMMLLLFALTVGLPENGIISGVFLEMCLTLFLTIYSSSAIGLVVSSISKNSDKAMTTAPFLLIIQLLFSGILFKLKDMTEKISYITVSRWSVSALGSICDLNALPMSVSAMPHEAESIYEHTASNLLSAWAVMAGFILICGVLCVILLRNVSKDSR